LYETEEEHRAVLTPFLRRGLEKGEKVVYVADARSSKAILGYLRRDRLKVDSYLASGQLSFLNVDQAYLRGGVFDPNRMINLMRAETKRALAEGYAALRVTGEMSWAVRRRPGLERLVEYESKLAAFPGSKCPRSANMTADGRLQTAAQSAGHASVAVVGAECEASTASREGSRDRRVDLAFAMAENLTSRKRAEEALHRTHDEVEQRAQERTADLEEVNAGLQGEITRRKQMAEALRESEDCYRDFVEHSRDLICTHDLEGRILSLNALPAHIMGYDRANREEYPRGSCRGPGTSLMST
jgi:PAS domain-containing protein